MTGRPASRHGHRVVDPHEALTQPQELPWLSGEHADGDLSVLRIVCSHGRRDDGDADRAGFPGVHTIAEFWRVDGEAWTLRAPRRSAWQDEQRGRRPGVWRFQCTGCTPLREVSRVDHGARGVQAILSAAWETRGSGSVDLRML